MKEHDDIPIILLTAMGEVDDRIAGFEAGADDYLPKPFDPRELDMRLQAVLNRLPAQSHVQTQKIRIGPWEYEMGRNELIGKETSEFLTDVEVNLLCILAEKPGQAITREELSRRCGLDAEKRAIDVQVTRLRKKLEEDGNRPRYLQTVRGKGYLLRAEYLD